MKMKILYFQSASQQMVNRNSKPGNQPSISITPLPRQSSGSANAVALSAAQAQAQAKQQGGKTSFVICEICDGYIKVMLMKLKSYITLIIYIHFESDLEPTFIFCRTLIN